MPVDWKAKFCCMYDTMPVLTPFFLYLVYDFLTFLRPVYTLSFDPRILFGTYTSVRYFPCPLLLFSGSFWSLQNPFSSWTHHFAPVTNFLTFLGLLHMLSFGPRSLSGTHVSIRYFRFLPLPCFGTPISTDSLGPQTLSLYIRILFLLFCESSTRSLIVPRVYLGPMTVSVTSVFPPPLL